MCELREIIKSEIKSNGRISFERFMDLALYDGNYGYYTSGNVNIGREGDFYTSPYVNKAFGEVVTNFVLKSLPLINSSLPSIVEIGGGKGTLAKDILDTIEAASPDTYNNIIYKYIENSECLIKEARSILNDHIDKIEFIDDITDIEETEIEGVVISNELFDSIPFHRMVMDNSIIKEVYVTLENNTLVETTDEPSTEELKRYISEYRLELNDGQGFEINLGVKNILSHIAKILKKGIVLTIDYGYLAPELYNSSRMKGTFKCMKDHIITDDPYISIGEQDITAHVNFTDLINNGDKFGLKEVKYTTQGQFLVDWGILDILEKISKIGDKSAEKTIAAVKNLFLPGLMGNKFKVLIQERGLGNEISNFYPESPFRLSFDIV